MYLYVCMRVCMSVYVYTHMRVSHICDQFRPHHVQSLQGRMHPLVGQILAFCHQDQPPKGCRTLRCRMARTVFVQKPVPLSPIQHSERQEHPLFGFHYTEISKHGVLPSDRISLSAEHYQTPVRHQKLRVPELHPACLYKLRPGA